MIVPDGPFDVLLVEDDRGDEFITREAFETNKIYNRLHVVHDGEEALDFLHRRGAHVDAAPPGLILLDVSLPKLDGLEVLASIKADPTLAEIPLVVLTASEAETDILRSHRLPADAYATKPFDLERFFQVIGWIDDFILTIVRLPRP